MKPSKFSIAVVLVNPKNSAQVLAVKRPPDDEGLPNVWGLPAITPQESETPEAAVVRLGKEKLMTDIEPVTTIGTKEQERSAYHLRLVDIEAKLVGDEPDVTKATTTGTKYTDQQWTEDFSLFKDAARKGSVCTQIFLESKGISWE